MEKSKINVRTPQNIKISHGQLYVALSRCKNPKNIYIQNNLENSLEIVNIVWEEILDD